MVCAILCRCGQPASRCTYCDCREFLKKLCTIVGNEMAELGSQRAAAAAEAAGKAVVYKLERDLSAVESSIVLEPYTGEDLKEILKAAEVLHPPSTCGARGNLCCQTTAKPWLCAFFSHAAAESSV